jgi:hypothetical protein
LAALRFRPAAQQQFEFFLTSDKFRQAASAEMLSLPNDGRYPALDLAPEERSGKKRRRARVS